MIYEIKTVLSRTLDVELPNNAKAVSVVSKMYWTGYPEANPIGPSWEITYLIPKKSEKPV